ncbi:MAG: DMT family transporter [Microbacteriaceae bacterium]|nr:DMT family transporter [Microbacteriaceae bacterium]
MKAAGTSRWSAFAALVGAPLFWAGNYVVAGEAIAETDPWTLSLLRWAGAAVILLIAAQLIERPDWRNVLRRLPRLAIMGAFGMIGFGALLYLGLETTTAVNASLVGGIGPVLIAAAAAVVLRERLGWRVVLGLAIALLGVLLVVSHGSLDALLGLRFEQGDLWIVAATAAWTVYTILGRKQIGIPPLTSVGVQAAAVGVLLVPVVAVTGWHAPQSMAAWWGVGFIVLFPSVGSYLLWNFAVRRAPAAIAGLFLNLIPVFTVVIALLMGKAVSWPQAVGGVVVLAGVLLATLPTRTPRPIR